ncbi:MAG TPA: hypothetical protein V6D25_25280 [Leptolyngbyaceae cyanobacterium]
MYISPGYSALLDKLRTQQCSGQSWTNIPGPPPPTGINQFPLPPQPQLVSRQPLEDRVLVENRYQGQIIYQEVLENQCLAVIGTYHNFLNATATPNTPFSREISVAIGASQTSSFEVSFGLSLGISIGSIADLSASLTTTLGHSITLHTETKITDTFSITPAQNTDVSVSWWQATYAYRLEAQRVIRSFGDIIGREPFSDTFQDNANTFIATQYPAATTSDSPLFIAKFGDFKL